MCDFFSWGVLKPSVQKQLGLKSRIIFLEDDMAQSLIDRGENPYGDRISPFTWDDVTGHEAIAAYYRISRDDFKHLESTKKVPMAAAKAINAGRMDKIMANLEIPKHRFNGKGQVKPVKLEDNLGIVRDLIAIDRYCTEIGKRELIEDARSTYLTGIENRGLANKAADVNKAMTWSCTPQGEEFWGNLWFKQTGKDWISAIPKDSKPWETGSPGAHKRRSL